MAKKRKPARVDEAFVDYSKDTGYYTPTQLIEAAEAAGLFVFDLETDSLNPFEGRIEGIAFYVPRSVKFGPVRAWFPFVANTFLCYDKDGELHDLRPAMPQRETMEALRPLFQQTKLTALGHGTKFDISFLRHASGADEPVEVDAQLADSMIADYLQDERQYRYGLKARVREVFGHEMTTYAEAARGQALLPFTNQQPLGSYAMSDCQWTHELYLRSVASLRTQTPPRSTALSTPIEQAQGRPLGRLEAVYWGIGMKLVRVLMEMETTGVLIDWQHLMKVEERLTKQQQELAHRIEDYLGWPLNPHAPQQVADALFAPPPDGLGLPRNAIPIGKSGIPSTSDKVIKHFKRFHPLVQDILEQRSLDVLLTSFVIKLRKLAQEASDGKIRCKYSQTGTVIGRLSSSDPYNGQNLPRDKDLVRKAFCASLPEEESDLTLLDGDYSQVELRVLSHLAEEDAMREVYRMGKVCRADNGQPCVRFTFCECKKCGSCLPPFLKEGKQLCGKCSSPEIEHQARCRHVDLHQRTAEDAHVKRNPLAKNLNFGLAYRMAAMKFCIYADLFDADARPMVGYAQDVINKWFAAYPGVGVYHEKMELELPQKKWIARSIAGRLRRLGREAQINSYRAVTQGIQFTVSGSAQDLIQIAMVRIFEERERRMRTGGPAERKEWARWRFLSQIHDQLTFIVPKVIANEAGLIFKDRMEHADSGALSVPLVCEVKTGRDFDSVH